MGAGKDGTSSGEGKTCFDEWEGTQLGKKRGEGAANEHSSTQKKDGEKRVVRRTKVENGLQSILLIMAL